MSRLYVRFYAALLGSLIVFALAAGLIWHRVSGPPERIATALGALIQNALPPADAPVADQEHALQKLVLGSDANIALRARNGTLVAKTHGFVDSANAREGKRIGIDDERTAWTIDLPDG